MRTPICDFVAEYERKGTLRLHMPGHKGKRYLGCETCDITEIEGADSLYCADGIIAESERLAGEIFEANTFYSAEGSSLCIRAMIHLCVAYGKQTDKPPLILAGRNAHKAFISALALVGADVEWISGGESYLSCVPDADVLDRLLSELYDKPIAVYITSPDYLGKMADIGALARVCHRHGVLLAVDNAHGAYLKFLPSPSHPIELGADICCDSAHKTLSVLTGGAYLHVSANAPDFFCKNAKDALALFGSTSPSYLILQSLDKVNEYLSDGYSERLADFSKKACELKEKLIALGYELYGDEPLKLTLCPKSYGYEGRELADILLEKNAVCEFSDKDFTVMMLTPDMGQDALDRLFDALVSIPRRSPVTERAPKLSLPRRAMSIREAVFSPCETVRACDALGRVLSDTSVACPPAVPLAVCGEVIDENVIRAFEYYGVDECKVLKKA